MIVNVRKTNGGGVIVNVRKTNENGVAMFAIERVYSPDNEQHNLMSTVSDRSATQTIVAGCYADCIRADYEAKRRGVAGCDWRAINAAIMQRWPRGLTRVKEKAWKLLRTGAAG